jgi:hypothetical protein
MPTSDKTFGLLGDGVKYAKGLRLNNISRVKQLANAEFDFGGQETEYFKSQKLQ